MKARLYGLFIKKVEGNKVKWERQFPGRAYPKAQAVRIFQSSLLSLFFAGKSPELRPVKE
jgi:hypothetical protein